jgi:hypothetical protein
MDGMEKLLFVITKVRELRDAEIAKKVWGGALSEAVVTYHNCKDGRNNSVKYQSDAAKIIPKAARKTKDSYGKSRNAVTWDHIVPHAVCQSWLLECKSTAEIQSLLEKYSFVVEITHEEDARLNALHLRSKMPAGWGPDNDDIFARYRAANIQGPWSREMEVV